MAVRPFQNFHSISNNGDSASALRLQRLLAFGITGSRAALIATMVWEVANG